MDLIIGLIVAVKSLVFMGGYISPDKLPVKIAGMQVNISQTDIRVSCTIANAFTPDLKKLAQSGTPILLYVFTSVKRADDDRYNMIGKSPAMEKVLAEIRKVAPTNGRVLISGESGTAQELTSMMEIKTDRTGGIFTKAMPLSQAQDELEREYVRTQLELNGWDVPKTADVLGIQRTNLHRKIRQLGIEKR